MNEYRFSKGRHWVGDFFVGWQRTGLWPGWLCLWLAVDPGFAVGISGAARGGGSEEDLFIKAVLSAGDSVTIPGGLEIQNPLDETLFPLDFAPPAFCWLDDESKVDSWLVRLQFQDREPGLDVVVYQPNWTPPEDQWSQIKRRSLDKGAHLTIMGFQRDAPDKILSSARITFTISRDEVSAPIFFREISLPMTESARDPSKTRWRLGAVSSLTAPRVVLDKAPVCGNCHSFSADGKWLAMDFDYESRGSHLISQVAAHMTLASRDFMNWDRFAPGQKSSGLLSQISPDGHWIISTVKDRAVLIQKPELGFSQLFFPVQGILAYRKRESDLIQALPGADDPQYVQTNPAWSPDGQWIVFARCRDYGFTNRLPAFVPDAWIDRAFTRGGQPLQYDLYRIPFNQGRGANPEPLRGASNNGKSNFFPKYSPDGRWIVYCQAQSYMMLQPDSELYLIPATGGEARRLRGNTARMNSWHSWSPNSRWLVFSSKAKSPYTQLFLTHIDADGNSSPPVFLHRFCEPEQAANVPEFIGGASDVIQSIEARFAADVARVREGNELFKSGNSSGAIQEYQRALEFEPRNVEAHQRLGLLLFYRSGGHPEGLVHLEEAVRLAPRNPYVRHDLGMARLYQGRTDPAIQDLTEALNLLLDPGNELSEYSPADNRYKLGLMLSPRHRRSRYINPVPEMEFHLGLALFLRGEFKSSAVHLNHSISRFGGINDAKFRYLYALALAAEDRISEAVPHRERAFELQQNVFNTFELSTLLGAGCAGSDRFRDRVVSLEAKLQSPQPGGTP
jgi:Tol biopolymer transport system component